ncbi:MAG: hypothetical protein ACK5O2_08215, partial [Microthrixaceae bacterium]
LQLGRERAEPVDVTSDLFVAAIEEARAGLPPEQPSGGVDALVRWVDQWSPVRLAQECVTLVGDLAEADQTVLYSRVGSDMTSVAMHPPHLESPFAVDQFTEHFPWGVGDLHASRFVLVEDARELDSACGRADAPTIGDLGYASTVHLPLTAGNRRMGALHLYWTSPHVDWDDRLGALLRAVGVLALDRLSTAGRVASDVSVHLGD